MRIVDWAELSTLPVGTIFQGVSEYSVGELEILGDVWAYDGKPSMLISAQLMPNSNSVETLGLLPEELKSYGLTERDCVVFQPTGHGRDYGAAPGNRWLVWEQADRERMARWLLNPVEAAAEQNSDEYAVLMKVEDPR